MAVFHAVTLASRVKSASSTSYLRLLCNKSRRQARRKCRGWTSERKQARTLKQNPLLENKSSLVSEHSDSGCNIWLNSILIPLLLVLMFLSATLAVDVASLRILTDVRDSHKGILVCIYLYCGSGISLHGIYACSIYWNFSSQSLPSGWGAIFCFIVFRSTVELEEIDLKLVPKKSLAVFSDRVEVLSQILSSISRTVLCPNLRVNGENHVIFGLEVERVAGTSSDIAIRFSSICPGVPYPHGEDATAILVDVTSDMYSELTVIEVLLSFTTNLRVSILSQLGLENLLDKITKELSDRDRASLCAVVSLMTADHGCAVFSMGAIPTVRRPKEVSIQNFFMHRVCL